MRRVAVESARKKRVKSLPRVASSMPMPSSRTATRTLPSHTPAETVTAPPSGEYFVAFEIRLRSVWRRRSGSALTTRSPPERSVTKQWDSLVCSNISTASSISRAREVGSKWYSILPDSMRCTSRKSSISFPSRFVSVITISRKRRRSSVSKSRSSSSSTKPRMLVSGVRSSWLTVETRSSFSRSSSLRSVMSRRNAVNWVSSPTWMEVTESSSGKRLPSPRRPSTSRRLPAGRAAPGPRQRSKAWRWRSR